jgi:methyl-accepting chemotaxis protein
MKRISFFGLIILLNSFSNLPAQQNNAIITEGVLSLAGQQTERVAGRINGNIRVLKTLANIMGEYEEIPMAERRDRFDYMLLSTLRKESDIVSIYTVWKPNALDGMDSRYIGRTGSTPTGQYAIEYSGEKWSITAAARTPEDILKSMAHIYNPFALDPQMDHPVPLRVTGKDTYVVNMMVPIINPRLNERVGSVGFLLKVDIIQPLIIETVRDYGAITAMAVYSKNGVIIGSVFPERIGRMLTDADITLYGNNIRSAYNAVMEGKSLNYRSIVPFLEGEVEIIMMPLTIGNTTWTVMIASPTNYWKNLK